MTRAAHLSGPVPGLVSGEESARERRVVAIVLPDLLCELAAAPLGPPRTADEAPGGGRASRGAAGGRAGRTRPPQRPAAPLGVLLVARPARSAEDTDTPDGPAAAEPEATAVLAAVNRTAARFGVRAGQTVAEAQAFVSHLTVKEVTTEQLEARLGELAEVVLAFGPTAALEAPDTVWVDVTGAAHLSGGEEALALEVAARVRALGHAVRVAVSSGPRLAQAFARWGQVGREGALVVPPEETTSRVATLPIRALPVSAELAAWFVRLGVLTVGELSRLPRAASASRLGEGAGTVLDLAEGKDTAPLVAYVPAAMPREESTWEEPVSGVEPLLFVLRGLVSRLGARLEGRGEAVQALSLVVQHEGSIARFEGVAPTTALHFELASPMYRAEELFRVLSSRLGRTELPAPSVGLRVEARAITRALALQLHLSRYAAGLGGSAARGPETLPVVLAELHADLGKDRVGVLRLESSHRPEKKGRLVPVTASVLAPRGSGGAPRGSIAGAPWSPGEGTAAGRGSAPTRLLPRPVPFEGAVRVGATVAVEHRLYTVERVAFEQRLEAVEWWSPGPVSRDYVRVWLKGGKSVLEAIVYVDRRAGVRMLQSICD